MVNIVKYCIYIYIYIYICINNDTTIQRETTRHLFKILNLFKILTLLQFSNFNIKSNYTQEHLIDFINDEIYKER